MAYVSIHAPAVAHVVGRGSLQVVRSLGVRNHKVIGEGMRPFKRDPFPAAGEVELGVVYIAAVGLSGGVGVGQCSRSERAGGFGARVEVFKQPYVQAVIAERAFIATIEIHFQVAAWVPSDLRYIGVPVAEVETARVGVVEAALESRLADRLGNAAKPVVCN